MGNVFQLRLLIQPCKYNTYSSLNKKHQTDINISHPLATPIVLDSIATNHPCYKLTVVLTSSKIPAVHNQIISLC